MYDKIKDEITQKYYVEQYSNDGQRFVAWYLRNIHNLDELQAKSCITDGADDKQIDAIYVDDSASTVYIIQGKFIGYSQVDAEPLREVLASWIRIKNLKTLQEDANNKLKQKLTDLSDALQDDYDICFELITTSFLTEAAQSDLRCFQEELASFDDLSASIQLVDNDELARRYDMALDQENPIINHTVSLLPDKYLQLNLGNTKAVLVALPLKECIRFPGIKDGTLFKKNVRQSLGLSNAVNKGIKHTIYNDPDEFFFFHNGVTAICTGMEIKENKLVLKGLSVVNGCQSLNTILSCSEQVKAQNNSYIMFRFYEIPERNRADKISVSTNSQSAVKARDLRSNDKKVLALKKAFEQKYTNGYMLTKRGEIAPANKDKDFIIDLSDLGKYLMAWQSQRPNISYSESKIFDKYFEQIFKKDYHPDNIQALNKLNHAVLQRWVKENPLGLNESLLAMKSYAPYHHMYAVSLCFCIASNMPESVPNPAIALAQIEQKGLYDEIVDMAGSCLNTALETAANEPQLPNRVFSPQNWIKTKTCLAGIRAAIRAYLSMLPSMPGGKELSQKYKAALALPPECFEERWSAD
ncbi:AIPR family protein [Faecalispora sporosphaeroides]|uniref:AIPR family protein n=1 Tax=Faecalispora sporosphaeroides TaxID=1549 RepID=UPI00037BC20E|nr:AIPR family protein [Faecalispora sporosphaeroides]